jgi:hypothetical protein
MFRRVILLVPALLLLVAQSEAAPTPPQPKPDDSVSSPAIKLLKNRKIQKELKMSADQRIAIYDGLADIEEDYDKKTEELSRNPNATDEMYEKLDKDREKAVDKLLNDSVTKGLTAAQRSRLRQLDWQLRGPLAFNDDQVAKKLILTDDQKKKAADIAERMKGELNRYINNLGNGNGDDAKNKAELFKFRKELQKEMVDALTDDQKTSWKNLIGEDATGFAVNDLWLKIEQEGDLELGLGQLKNESK